MSIQNNDAIQNKEVEKNQDIKEYQELLDILFNDNSQSLSKDELDSLLKIFPDDADCSFKKMVEIIQSSRGQFKELLQSLPSVDLQKEIIKRLRRDLKHNYLNDLTD